MTINLLLFRQYYTVPTIFKNVSILNLRQLSSRHHIIVIDETHLAPIRKAKECAA